MSLIISAISFTIFALVAVFALVVFRGAPYMPAHRAGVEDAVKMLRKIKLNPTKDFILDLGSGDGKFLRAISRLGYRSVGYELNPFLVLVGRLGLFKYKESSVLLRDFWVTSFPEDTKVVYTFLLDRYMPKLDKKMQEEANRLKKDLYLLSYIFIVPNKKSVDELGGVRGYLYKAK